MTKPTAAELLARARAMHSTIAGRAAECEALRRIPDANIAEFEAAGFFRMIQPGEYGGYELSPLDLFQVSIEIAKACPSSGWVLNLLAVHNWEVALLEPQAGAAIWGSDDRTRLSSSYAPFGKVQAVEGGFRVGGRWPWSSGCDHGQWAILGGIAHDEAGNADPRSFFIPRSDYVIDDTWHVIGLKGTGSKDIVVEDAFVPSYLTHRFADSFLGTDPGLAHFSHPNFRYPFGIVFAYCLASVTIGMAEGAYEEFRSQMSDRTSAYDNSRAVEDPFVQHRIAEAGALVRGIRLRLESNFAEMETFIASGEPLPLELRVRNKWDAQVIAKQAKEAVDLLFKASGGRGIREENPIQRYFRDIHAASNHAFLNADKGSLNAGLFDLAGIAKDLAL